MKHASYYRKVRSNELNLIKPKSKDRVLDVGCGEGLAAAYLKAMQKDIYVLGVEPYCDGFTPELDEVYGNTVERFLEEYAGDHFDLILCLDVLEHIWTYSEVLEDLVSNLKSGGTLLISVPNVNNFRVLSEIILRNNFPKHKEGIFDETHCRWFTKRTLKNDLAKFGFQRMSFSYSGIEFGKLLFFVNLVTFGLFRRFLGFQVIAICKK